MQRYKYGILLSFLFASMISNGQDGQLTINRVESMPNQPSPYNMRDWRDVAIKYDAFVFDSTKVGDYLPLVFFDPSGTSYPERPTFGLHTYVGTNNTNAGEGINVLPAVVGASLVGVDKTTHYARNWVLMAQDYFRKGGDEGIYLNNRGGKSGNDWWYDMMPNIYFYQLYDLYGPIGDFEFQFHSVANQMQRAVEAMGGSATPWRRASMNYRAWNFSTMTPNDEGVQEPEAAGAYAWLLYNAYRKTNNEDYLRAAEWSMEFLNSLGSNPSYELQLPYGAYVAARMNAELNTSYSIEKLLFWVFNRGPLRGWGNIVGEWGGLDVSGLVGEANDGGNDYAFQMNGTQQASALVPLVRYDERYARTVGKWLLNMANATRLMFPGYLPASLQDGSDWSDQYDPDGVIGYEAMREVWEGKSPFATGDAVRGGWAATNLCLYGTSSIGYLGGLMELTDVEMILKVDLLKTDFFRDTAYPSFLYYNPHTTEQSVSIDVGNDPVDIYNALSGEFLSENVSGETTITIPADQAVSIVLAPAGGSISYDKNRMLINDVIVDYAQNDEPWNGNPRIQALAVLDTNVVRGDTIDVWTTATDLETKDLIYQWSSSDGILTPDDEDAVWIAPDALGQYTIGVIVIDEAGQMDTAEIVINVVEEVNIPPVISSIAFDSRYTAPSGSIQLTCIASDDNNDALEYNWNASGGTLSGAGQSVEWQAPSGNGIFTVSVVVNDGRGGTDNASTNVISYEFVNPGAQEVAVYPFNGNADDESGNGHHGDVSGAKLTEDRNGAPSSAYFFDGINDNISVANDAELNFEDGITLSCWIHPMVVGDKEVFILSHGSWQNRWKLSIVPEGNLRWTLKAASGAVRDLDSETMINEGEWYHVAATYDGSILTTYINAKLESATQFSGSINSTTIDLEIGQMLPDEIAYNFRGDIDDISIYDQALTPDEISALSGITSTRGVSWTNIDFRIWPNPVNDLLTVDAGDLKGPVYLDVVNESGQKVMTKRIETMQSKLELDVRSLSDGIYFIAIQDKDSRGVAPFVKKN